MKSFFFAIIITFTFPCFSQNEISWSFGFDAQSSTLTFTAKLQEGWHVYSITPNEGGPVPTSFEFKDNGSFTVKGNIIEPTPIQVYDENFATNVQYFSNEVTFKQPIQVKSSGKVEGNVVYMICNDQMCFPPEEQKFTITISN